MKSWNVPSKSPWYHGSLFLSRVSNPVKQNILSLMQIVPNNTVWSWQGGPFGKNTVSPLVCGKHWYQTAAGTRTKKKLPYTHSCTQFLSIATPLSISLFLCSCVFYCVSFQMYLPSRHPLYLCVGLHCRCLVCYCFSRPSCSDSRINHTQAAGDPEAPPSSLGHTNLISWQTELSWCKLVCLLCSLDCICFRKSSAVVGSRWSISYGSEVVQELVSQCIRFCHLGFTENHMTFEVPVGCDQNSLRAALVSQRA